MSVKHDVFRAVFAALATTGAHRLFGAGLRGRGAILMLHEVGPDEARAYAPNRLLRVTPSFLDAVLQRCRALGLDLVSMDEAVARLGDPDAPPFAAVTCDDGYRDTLEVALPVLRRHGAPVTVYVTPGFAERTAPLWWLDLEQAIARLDRVRVAPDIDLPAGTDREKARAFSRVYWTLREGPEERLREVIAGLARSAGVDSADTVARLCLDWDGLRTLSQDPLVTLGAHTMSHPMLAKHAEDVARREMDQSRERIAQEIGRPVHHFAYPVGDPGSAGPRDFALAAELGFRSAVTTRPGMLFADHAVTLTALPRVSLNGLFQRIDQFDVLMSGLPFWMWNRGRRLNVA